jgi:Uma2 family endonuclease
LAGNNLFEEYFIVAPGNWKADLKEKPFAYAELGVSEYFVVDYSGAIPDKDCDRGRGIQTIGFTLNNGRYDRQEYLGDEIIVCRTFPDLQLTTLGMVNCSLE